MPIQNLEIKSQEDIEYTLMPEDIYVCKIKDLEEIDQKKYNSDETEKAIRVKLIIAEGEYTGSSLIKTVRPIINTGFEGGQASNLYILMRSVLGDNFEHSLDVLNSIIGQQVRAVVKVKKGQKGEYNVVDDFMKVKGEIRTEDIPVIEPVEDKIPF